MTELIEQHKSRCQCGFCRLDKSRNFRLYYLINSERILGKRVHSGRWIN